MVPYEKLLNQSNAITISVLANILHLTPFDPQMGSKMF